MMATQAPLTPGHSSKHSCPLCRTAASSREILQPGNIKRTPSPLKSHRFSGLFLRGAPSKMEAVVRSVSKLFDEDPETKILIFSDYGDVLQDYHAILKRNGFEAVHAANKTKIPENIQKLRDGKASILLMPISFGGKGLTIIEANHLFFLEPLLNKGAELQAIGRIYRMGQQKPTFVHKFIVEQTIEEQIHTMMSSVGQEGNLLEENLTLRQVLSLLKSSGAHGPDLDDGDFWTNLQSGTEPSTSQGITSPSDAGPSTSAM